MNEEGEETGEERECQEQTKLSTPIITPVILDFHIPRKGFDTCSKATVRDSWSRRQVNFGVSTSKAFDKDSQWVCFQFRRLKVANGATITVVPFGRGWQQPWGIQHATKHGPTTHRTLCWKLLPHKRGDAGHLARR